VRFLIVDPHAKARLDLISLCNQAEGVEVVGEAVSGVEALEAAGRLRPDVVLLNIALPDMTGIELLRALQSRERTARGIIVARHPGPTAVGREALDYLTTPISKERFDEAVARARQDLMKDAEGEVLCMDTATEIPRRLPHYLVGERQRRLYPLEVQSIDYIEVDRNYVTLRAGRVEYLSRDSITRLSSELAGFGFIRIERSVLMNLRSVAYVEPAGHGTFAFTLRSGVCLHSSSTYRSNILRALPLPAMSKRHRKGAAEE
jgi:two-component system, LytTR family, response regulator